MQPTLCIHRQCGSEDNETGERYHASKNGHPPGLSQHPSGTRRQTPTRPAMERPDIRGPGPPFGLRSAPMIFSAIADILLWIMQNKGATWGIHYIDDFLTAEAPDSQECLQNTLIMQSVCEEAAYRWNHQNQSGPPRHWAY